MDQFQKWAIKGSPPQIFWISGFSFPTGFLTAMLQIAARRQQKAINTLRPEFTAQTDG